MDSGDAVLGIDGYNGADTVLFGAGNTFTDVAVNIDFSAGTLKNLAAGANQNGKVGSVDLTIRDDATISGVSYAGGFGDVDDEISTTIRGGTFVKDFYGGALANYAKSATATTVGDIILTINGGSFSGNIYGASAVKASAEDAHHAGSVTLTVTGGSTTKGDQACIFAGGYATGNATDATVYTIDSVSAAISGGSWGLARGGRGVYGGVMASGVTAQAGDVNITISGDATMGNVYGGGWAQKNGSSIVGDVNIRIEGGTVDSVFGSGTHSSSGGATSVNDVTIVVSGGNISGAIYARGKSGGDTVANADVIFTGDKAFSCDVFGYSYNGDASESDAMLYFTDYTGSFSGKVGGFNGVTFDGDTAMTLGVAADDFSNSDWTFDVAERGAEYSGTALLNWSAADFGDDIITLNLAVDDPAGEWSLVSAAANTNYYKFDVQIDGESILSDTLDLDDEIADGDYAGWGFTLDDGVLKFKNLAGA